MPLVEMLQLARARGIVDGLRPGLALTRITELEPLLGKFIEEQIAANLRLFGDGEISDERALRLIRGQQTLASVCVEAMKLGLHEKLEGTAGAAIIESADPAITDEDCLPNYLAEHRRRLQSANAASTRIER